MAWMIFLRAVQLCYSHLSNQSMGHICPVDISSTLFAIPLRWIKINTTQRMNVYARSLAVARAAA